MSRRKRFAAPALAVTLAAVASQLVSGPALGATISSATFAGNGSTAVVAGSLFARTGAALTLTVVTDAGTNCVALTGAHSASATVPTSVNGTNTWTLALAAAAGPDGSKTTTITAFDDAACSNGSSSVTRSYAVDNTGPTVTAAVSPSANAAAWFNSDVAISWSAVDTGSGVASGPTPAADSQTVSTPSATKTSTATDRVGNVGHGSINVKLDKEAPSITANRNPAPNTNGWNNTNVTVSFACSDPRSGIRSCPGQTTLSANGAGQTVAGTARDFADNLNSTTVTVNIDKLAPTLSGAPSTAPNSAGWHKADVSVDWTCSDTGGSGVASGACADTTITGEGAGLVSTKSVADLAGNSSGAATSAPAVNIDRTAPVTSASAVPGWTEADVDVSLSAADGLSGVASTSYRLDAGSPQTYAGVLAFASEGAHVLEFWSTDNAGNEETHRQVNVLIDRTAPTISASQSPAANVNGWNNGDVTVSFACTDADSGVATCSGPQSVTDEGVAQPVGGSATDNAGNTASTTATVSVDKTAPTIGASAAPEPNANGWNNSDVTVTFHCTDALSGIDACAVAATLSGEGAGQTATGSATDNAGNSASASVTGVNIDKTAPTLSGAPQNSANGAGWYRDDVTVAWTCVDALSGVAGGCAQPSVVSGEGASLSAGASVADRAGNQASANVTGLRIDRTAPTAAVTGVTAGATYVAGTYSAACSSADALSGVATPSSLRSSGGPTGLVTLTCDGALDVAGNPQAARASVSINVLPAGPNYTFGGFQRPVSAAPKLNDAKAGAAVPIKFSVGGFRGMNIFESGFPKSAGYTCSTSPDTARAWDPTETNGGLAYDARSDTYTFVWKTTKSFAGSCRVLAVKFADGSGQRAVFRFDR